MDATRLKQEKARIQRGKTLKNKKNFNRFKKNIEKLD